MAGGGIAATGVLADEHCRVVDWNNKTIDGLYVVGNSQARMDNGALMQSGITNARGITHGYLAGRHAAGKPSELLAERLGVGGVCDRHDRSPAFGPDRSTDRKRLGPRPIHYIDKA